MQRIFAIAKLTWKAAFRFRLFWVLTVLLLLSVVALPMLIRDDGTARGFTQILLTYTLSTITALLGVATLWLSCGTLARDVEEAQMQMVATKPIARWELWMGKWIGIVALNAVLLAIAGGSVFGLLQWRAKRLPASEQTILRNEIFVARGSFKPPLPDLGPEIEKAVQARIQQARTTLDRQLLRNQIAEQMKADLTMVPVGYVRGWKIDPGITLRSLRDQPLFLRIKFHSPETRPVGDSPTYRALIFVGPPNSQNVFRIDEPSLAAETFHEFRIPPNLFSEDGTLNIAFINQNRIGLLFPLDEGIEVLYREGGFGLNFARGLGIILCWLTLLSAVGLCAASFLSFPVAAFFSAAVLILGMSTGTLTSVSEDGTLMGLGHEGENIAPRAVDAVGVPLFRGMLKVINLVQGFSPITALSDGRSVTWGQLGLAFTEIVLLMGGIFALVGVISFNRRELATAQGTTT